MHIQIKRNWILILSCVAFVFLLVACAKDRCIRGASELLAQKMIDTHQWYYSPNDTIPPPGEPPVEDPCDTTKTAIFYVFDKSGTNKYEVRFNLNKNPIDTSLTYIMNFKPVRNK